MKGIVFTELLEMVENKFGYQLVDELLTESNLPSGGIYTTIGTYDHAEMVTILHKLSQHTGLTPSELLRAYGQYMFTSFSRIYRPFVERADSAFALLNSVQHYIHVEVRKLYPDAELPHFSMEHPSDSQLVMLYESERKMADFAHGMIEGCLTYYGESATVTKTDLSGDGSVVRFDIQKN
ncbi:heme NO-binding domain-containing protein [Spirosoma luteolum]